MAALWFDNAVLQAGINRHMAGMKRSGFDMDNGDLDPRDLYFDSNTIQQGIEWKRAIWKQHQNRSLIDQEDDDNGSATGSEDDDDDDGSVTSSEDDGDDGSVTGSEDDDDGSVTGSEDDGDDSELGSVVSRTGDYDVFVKTVTGDFLTLEVDSDFSIEYVKLLIQDAEAIPTKQQRLIFSGMELQDGQTLADYGIDEESIIELDLCAGCSAYRLHPDCFSPEHNYDFTDLSSDRTDYMRGGQLYRRPLGAMRWAMNVLGVYENDDWLGVNNGNAALMEVRGNTSVDLEWPVAYHGTEDPRAAQIVKSGGLKLGKGTRFLFGRGIYCTPDPKTALAYAKEYVHNGQKYKLVLQVRVDPTRMKVVPKATHRCPGLDDYWIVNEDGAIRPYGICVFPC